MVTFKWPGILQALLDKCSISNSTISNSTISNSTISGSTIGSSIMATAVIGTETDNTTFEEDGTIKLNGDATVWEDLTEVLTSVNLYSTPGKADYDWDENMVVLQPSGSITTNGDIVNQTYQIRHSTKIDSDLKLHIHWVQPSSATRQFTWKYRILKCGEAPSDWSSNIVVNATGAANAFTYVSGGLFQITMLGDISLVDVPLSSAVQIKLARTDAITGDIFVSFMDLHYEKSDLGSSEEYVK